MSFGVLAAGHALGEAESVAEAASRYTDDLRRIKDWGYRCFHRAAAGTGLTDLAELAGRAALNRSGVKAADVDLLVLAMADIPEHLYWDPAAACQARLGAHQAEAILASQACSAGVAAFDLVAGKFATHPEYHVALLVAAHRVCETYRNRIESDVSLASDGAAAVVLARHHDRYRWLTTEIISDGRYADLSQLPAGGAARPFSPRLRDPGVLPNPFDRLEEQCGQDVRAMLELTRRIARNRLEVVERACKRASVRPEEIRYMLHLNENLQLLTKYAASIGVPLEATNAALAVEHGHLGSADQIFALGVLLEEGRPQPGEVVALTSTGSGMHWACTLLRS